MYSNKFQLKQKVSSYKSFKEIEREFGEVFPSICEEALRDEQPVETSVLWRQNLRCLSSGEVPFL